MSPLCNLSTGPLLEIWFVTYFLHSVRCLLTFSMVSFDAQIFLALMTSSLLVFFLWLIVLLVMIRQIVA